MKKHILSLITCLICAVCFLPALAACGGGGGGGNNGGEPVGEKQDAPVAIEKTVGTDAITIIRCNFADGYMRLCEYKLDGGEWMVSDNGEYVFDGLIPGSEHTLQARAAKNGSLLASDPYTEQVTLSKLKTDGVPDIKYEMVTGKKLKLYHNGTEASFDYGESWTDAEEYEYSENGKYTVRVRYKESATAHAGENYQSITVSATDFDGGLGSEVSPFLASNYAQLQALGGSDYKKLPFDSYIKLTADIVCPSSADTIPCPRNVRVHLDGNGKKITNFERTLEINNSESSKKLALFERLDEVKNLTVENAVLKCVYNEDAVNVDMAVIAYWITGNGAENCHVSGALSLDIAEGEAIERDYIFVNIGGIAVDADGVIKGCTSDIKIKLPESGDRKVDYKLTFGGLAAYCENIELSSAKFSLEGVNGNDALCGGGDIGGLAQRAESVKNCYAEINIKLRAAVSYESCYALNAGGLLAETTGDGRVENSFAAFNINATAERKLNAGGLAATAETAAFVNCFADGKFSLSGNAVTCDAFCTVTGEGVSAEKCYFNEGLAQNNALNAQAVARATIRSAEWQKTLGWDETVWKIGDGVLNYHPTLI